MAPGESTAQLVGGGPLSYWKNLGSNTKKAIMVLGIVALLVILILFFTLSGGKIEQICVLSTMKPDLEAPRALRTEPDFKNMIKFKGYIRTRESQYLPLDINRMTIDKQNDTIYLKDSCATIAITYLEYRNIIEMSLTYLDWTFEYNTEGSKESHTQCRMSILPFIHKFPKNLNRYSCLEKQEHRLVKKNDKCGPIIVAELVVESLEMEFDGDVEKIRAGNFSKPPYPTSCKS